jgi:hypothetical protein
MDNALQAKQNQQWSASNRALELLGKELGLFADRSGHGFYWDGDPNTLTEEQQEKLAEHLIRLAVGDDPQIVAEAKRRLEGGETVTVEAMYEYAAERVGVSQDLRGPRKPGAISTHVVLERGNIVTPDPV